MQQLRRAFAVPLLAFVAFSGCSSHRDLAAPAAPLTPPSRLCGIDDPPSACRTGRQVEELLSGRLEILGVADTPSGAQGAKLLTLRGKLGDRAVTFRVKWRPQSSAGLINEPRKELASYAVQKLFLNDGELVAPPTAARCFSLAEYRRFVPDQQSSFEQVPCVLGFASYWLESVETVDGARDEGWLEEGAGIFDRRLFANDPVYRRSIANANLLTYVINHGDAHNEQFLLEPTARGLRAYVVDSSIAFLSIKNPMLLVREDWSQIQVPSLPPEKLERLRALTQSDFDGLGCIAVLERRGDELHPLDVSRVSLKSDGTPMSWQQQLLRIGLTPNEINLVKSRTQALTADAK